MNEGVVTVGGAGN